MHASTPTSAVHVFREEAHAEATIVATRLAQQRTVHGWQQAQRHGRAGHEHGIVLQHRAIQATTWPSQAVFRRHSAKVAKNRRGAFRSRRWT